MNDISSSKVDLHATYIRRGELARALPWRVWQGVRRYLRRERRRYLVHDGHILATFASEQDYLGFLGWVSSSIGDAYSTGHGHGAEAQRAVDKLNQAITRDPGTP